MKGLSLLVLTVCGLLAGASGQDRDRLHRIYGDPIGEVFRAADDIFVTTLLSQHRNVCEVRIEHRWRGKTLTDDEVDPVLENVAPKSERGASIISVLLHGICPTDDCAGVREDYQWLSIIKIGTNNAYKDVTVRFNRPECGRPTPR